MNTRYTVVDDFIPEGMPRSHIAVVSERDAGHTLRRAIALTGPTHGHMNEQSLADAHRIAAALNAEHVPQPGVMHEIDNAFYKLTVKQRDAAWQEIEQLKARRDELVNALASISLGAQNSGESKEALGRIARAALTAAGVQP